MFFISHFEHYSIYSQTYYFFYSFKKGCQSVYEAIYTADEIKKLKGLSKDSLREIHKVKEVFENSKIEQVIQREDDQT